MGNRVGHCACVILGRFQPVHRGHALLIRGQILGDYRIGQI